MEVDVAPDDIEAETRNVEGLAHEPQSLLRGAISACRPEDDGFPAFLDRQLADPFVKASAASCMSCRTTSARARPFAPISAACRIVAAVRPLRAAGPVDKAIALADVAPSVQFVLDHCGVPAIKDRAEHPWRERIAEIARRPNVAVKISGVVAYAEPETWTVEDIRPYVEHALESFGWDRVVWGSDWPVCTLTASLSIWIAATHAITLGCSADERARLFSVNARRIWRLPG